MEAKRTSSIFGGGETDGGSEDQTKWERNPPAPSSPGPHLVAGVPETPTVEAQLVSHCVHHCLTSEPLGIYRMVRRTASIGREPRYIP